MAGASANDLIANRYRLDYELGKGGMGTVWHAHDDRLNRAVAVKLMARRLLLDKTAVDRFEREAKAVARLLSPHIVQIYDYGVDPQPFMVMELLQGENVSQRLTRETLLPVDEVATLMRQAARGLASAHEAGIVHRDLKPGNLFIVRDRDVEYVKVVDFGIAKAVRRQSTLTAITSHNQPVGTPQYMSPNQLRAMEDHRDDIWSLAVIAYKALSGVHPFASDSLVTLVQRIMDEPHVPPSHYEPALPPGLDAVFDRAFAKDREERFQSAPDFAAAIDELLTNTPAPLHLPMADEVGAESVGDGAESDVPGELPDDPMADELNVTSKMLASDLPPPLEEDHEEASITLVRPSKSPPPIDPTLVDSHTLVGGIDGILNVPTPTPPPAAGAPWPVPPPATSGAAWAPVAIGVALSLVTVVLAVWVLAPSTSNDISATTPARPAPERRTEGNRAEPNQDQPEPLPSTNPAAPLANPTASAGGPEPSAGAPPLPDGQLPRAPIPGPSARVAPTPPPRLPPSKRRKKGDDLFDDGPF